MQELRQVELRRPTEAIGAELVVFLRHQLREAGRLQEMQLAELMENKSAEMAGYREEIEQLYRDYNLASVEEERSRSIERWSALELSRTRGGAISTAR